MLISSPFKITSRLMPGIKIGDMTISMQYGDMDGHRQKYTYYIDWPIWSPIHVKDELSSGCNHGLEGAFSDLFVFLAAFAEDSRFHDNDDDVYLFPRELSGWAMRNEDEFERLSAELDENPGHYINEKS